MTYEAAESRKLVNKIITGQFAFEKQQGLHHNNVTSSLSSV